MVARRSFDWCSALLLLPCRNLRLCDSEAPELCDSEILRDLDHDGLCAAHPLRMRSAPTAYVALPPTCIHSGPGVPLYRRCHITHLSLSTTTRKQDGIADVARLWQILQRVLGIILSSNLASRLTLIVHLNLPWHRTPKCPVLPASLLEQSGSAKKNSQVHGCWCIAAVAMARLPWPKIAGTPSAHGPRLGRQHVSDVAGSVGKIK